MKRIIVSIIILILLLTACTDNPDQSDQSDQALSNQILYLENQIKKLKAENEVLQGGTDKLTTENKSLKAKIETLKSENLSLKNNKSNLEYELKKLKDKTDDNESVSKEAISPQDTSDNVKAYNSPLISKFEYDIIQTGMSYDAVCEIIGGKGTSLSESSLAGTTTAMYSWSGEGNLGANANIMFQDDEVISKAQYGLE